MCIVGYQLLLNDTSQNLFVIAIRMTTVNCSWKFNRIAFWKLNCESYDFSSLLYQDLCKILVTNILSVVHMITCNW